MIPNENPTYSLIDELEAELEKEDDENELNSHYEAIPTVATRVVEKDPEAQYKAPAPEAKALVNNKATVQETIKDTTFTDFESGDINFDKENEDLEENVDADKLAEKEEKEQRDKLSALIRQKISPVSKGFDISTFSISKRPASNVVTTPNTAMATEFAVMPKIEGVMLNTNRPASMDAVTHTENPKMLKYNSFPFFRKSAFTGIVFLITVYLKTRTKSPTEA
jgi:hypothetical protein